MAYTVINTLNIDIKILRKKPGEEAFLISFKFPRWGWDQRLADFNRFSSKETQSCYSGLVLYILDFSKKKSAKRYALKTKFSFNSLFWKNIVEKFYVYSLWSAALH